MKLILLIALAHTTCFGETNLFQRYETLHLSTLQRAANLENKIDGLSEELRNLLKDRKRTYDSPFRGRGKQLPDPQLINAVITERKRLEKEELFIDELRKSPMLTKQLEKKIASNLVALEITNLLLTFTEFLDEYNRGIKSIPGPKDFEVMKVLAGTHTALTYSKSKKEQIALADPQVLRLCKQESQETLKLVELGLGKMTEDTLFFIPPGVSKVEQEKLELKRLKRTKQLVSVLEELATLIAIANKSLSDEYQYRVLVLNQNMKEKRELSNQKTKP